MDDFEERLVYSDSENSDADETTNISEQPASVEPVERTTADMDVDDENEDDLNKSMKKTNKHFLSSDEEDNSNDITKTHPTQGEPHNKSGESDEEDFNKSVKKGKKNGRVLSSDDDESVDKSRPAVSVIRPSICDSESSSGEKSDIEIPKKKPAKKVKKKKPTQPKPSDESNSESDDESTEKQKKSKKKSHSSESGSGSSSNSESDQQENDELGDMKNIKPREKTAQRMSAKMAEEQMKEIQSESQRFARQLHANIPYHKPKQHSLKEFLSRRSIVQHEENLKTKPVLKAALAIKMSNEELLQYMHDMQKRTKEAEEFFQHEDDSAHINNGLKDEECDDSDEKYTPTGDKKAESADKQPETCSEMNGETEAGPSSPCQDDEVFEYPSHVINDIEGDEATTANNKEGTEQETTASQSFDVDMETESGMTSSANPPSGQADIVLFHTVRTELDDELDGLLPSTSSAKPVASNAKSSLFPSIVPKLQGDSNFMIDLETNDLKPKEKTGVEELFSRFLKHAATKPKAAVTQDVSIFQTDTGKVEQHKFHLSVDDGNPKAERRPGESLFKLRKELEQKIKENREKIIAQRLQEEKERKLLESEEELDDEELDDEELLELSDEEKPGAAEAMIQDEADCNENEADCAVQNEDENQELDSENESSDGNESDDSDQRITVSAGNKARKRILATMDDDSDNEQTAEEATNKGQIDDYQESIAPCSSTNNPINEPSNGTQGNDLSALESEILQLNGSTVSETSKMETSKLFEDNDYGDIGESQLMALCSGTFATQLPESAMGEQAPLEAQAQTQLQTNDIENGENVKTDDVQEMNPIRAAFLSSDEDELDNDDKTKAERKKKKLKKKKQTLVYSDDEDEGDVQSGPAKTGSDDEQSHKAMEDDQESVDDEEDPGETYIEYDSDENEIEVELKQKDIRRKASDFVENEAELSGDSEWGSADEDEQDMNRYEKELGDEDRFDKNQLRDELERIRLREQIDDDARAIRILTERYIEEEDNGQERERKFRWKHLNNVDNNDDQVQNADQEADTAYHQSDDENEAEWRRIRYEREQLLKQQISDSETLIERTLEVSSVNKSDSTEQQSVTTSFASVKRISITKPIASAIHKTTSPFLINKCDMSMAHLSRKSFLNRDSPILEKLASLSKTDNDGETILNTAKGKGNYVFVATEKKDTSKRKSDTGAADAGAMNPSKKSKIDLKKSTTLKPQTKAFFDSLN